MAEACSSKVVLVTIDINVARDCIDENRPLYECAQDLLDLARNGRIDLAIAPQGFRLDVPRGEVKARIASLVGSEGITELPQVARVSEVTYPSESLVPGATLDTLMEAWELVSADWKSHQGRRPGSKDRWHLETHLVAGRDVFVTNDRALLSMCDRLSSDHGIAIRASSLAEFVAWIDPLANRP